MPRKATRVTVGASADVSGGLTALALDVQRAGSEPEVRKALTGLSAALERTVHGARLCRQFRIGPGRPGTEASRLRDDLWQRFGPGTAKPVFLASCDRLIGRGVALTRTRGGVALTRVRGGGASAPRAKGPIGELGLIDLMGLADRHRQPVVLQVVRGGSLGATFSALVRVIGAVALLRRALTMGFREEWGRTLLAAGYGEPALPPVLGTMMAYVLVQSSDWRTIEKGASDPGSDISTLDLQRLHAFVDAAAAQRVFVSFAAWCDDGPYADRPMAWSVRLPGVGVGGVRVNL